MPLRPDGTNNDGLTDFGLGGPGLTTNFEVRYLEGLGNVANMQANANALLAVIENEFKFTTTNWFPAASGKFGATNRQKVYLNLATGGGGGNKGYGSIIGVDSQNTNNNVAVAGPMVCMVFMNEWVEILMSLSNGKWNSGNSSGEALSQFCGILRFQTGHYSYYTSWANQWLNGVLTSPNAARSDWVTNTFTGIPMVAGDVDSVSFGCALAFLYFLYSWLNYSVGDIIDAGDSTKKTLAALYTNLTGDPGNPWGEFYGLVNSLYPAGTPAAIPGPVSDNPFQTAFPPSVRHVFAGSEGVLYAIMDNGELHWYQNTGWQNGKGTWVFDHPRRVGKGWRGKHFFSGGDGVIYIVQDNGDLLWYRHDGWRDGAFRWGAGSGNKVGNGWDGRQIFGMGNGVIYVVKDNGDLLWYQHLGFTDGTFRWARDTGTPVGNGWDGKQVFCVGHGVIYTYRGNGDLLWYEHLGWQDGSGNWTNGGVGVPVGHGWDAWQIASFGNGFIYTANKNGDLLWYCHDGWSHGTGSWAPASGTRVGDGWNFCPVIYSVPENGDLMWYRHDGWGTGTNDWTAPDGLPIGSGWDGARIVFPGGNGVIYAVQQNGDLLWYRHDGSGRGTGDFTSPDGAPVGNGWSDARLVFPGGDGVIYAVLENGDLMWYRHDGWSDGSDRWTSVDGSDVGHGWNGARLAFSAGNGVIYAIQQNGDLLWYRHDGWGDGSGKWTSGGIGAPVGSGWGPATQVFPGGNGVIYAVQENGDLLWYRHDDWDDGGGNWTAVDGKPVGNGWKVRQIFAM
jgi:hypothetical protein